MKTVICGSRTIKDYQHVLDAVEKSGFQITEVVSGCANGVDRNGERYAELNGLPVKRFPANWEEQGRMAGLNRNVEMAEYAEAVIAIWDGQSAGTAHMIAHSRIRNLLVFVWKVEL